ncbi:MAG: hydrogen gas-evolving membrane-bound hydrogenase subunit E [Ilumatobacteraceae bacterium]
MLLFVLTLHAVVGITLIALGDRLGRWAFAAAGFVPAITLAVLAPEFGAAIDGEPVTDEFGWIPQLDLTIALRMDAFSVVMVSLVSGIGLLVCVYAVGYFSHPKPGTARLAGLLTLFAGAMLGVVLSDHLLSLFVFWELTSITSDLLIGNDDRNPKARDAALMAVLITGAGGLALLAGFILLGQSIGTYRISEMGDLAIGTSGTITAAVILILIGAMTKSAQVPFAGWLPGAMVAPTPISTYLHAATMVKAGVYLVARLSPVLAETGTWRNIILVFSSATMIIGGWRALRQHDLKLLLANGTVSQLGFMMLLFGMGEYELAQAGVTVLIAHGAFKAALFMVVGIVDHQVGTRDIRGLHGFTRPWWPVLAVATISAASMAGLPPLLGFIAKEKGLDGALHGHFAGADALVVVFVVGSILTFAYSARFVLGVFGRFGDADHEQRTATATPASWSFSGPSILLAVFTVAAGLWPAMIDELVSAATVAIDQLAHPKHLALWHGINTALMLSALIIAVGTAMTIARRPVAVAQRRFHDTIAWVPTAERSFWFLLNGTIRGAKRLTRIVQNGSLPIYLMVILGVVAVSIAIPAFAALGEWPEWIGTPIHVPLAGIVLAAAIGATVVHRRIAAALMLGGVGFGMAGFYVAQGAPDLALTQFAIEVLTTVMFVLVLRFLPSRFEDRRVAIALPLRIVIAAAVGVTVFVTALVTAAARNDVVEADIADDMVRQSVGSGDGHNVVNVILVDFRGADTLGEITVLVIAALGVVALARVARRPGDSDDVAAPPTTAVPSFARLPVVDVSARVLFASIMVLSVYFLFAGHNQPGGGFVGGLTAGVAISLRYVAGGVSSVRRSVRPKPWIVLGTGLAISVVTAIIPLLLGESFLEHAKWEDELPLLGKVKVTSALPFDIGVYLVVVGLVLMAYEAFGEDAVPTKEAELAEGATT